MRKKAAIIAVFVVLAASVFLLPLPVKIDRTMEGIRLESAGGQSFQECSVSMEGWYYRYLVRDNVFKGDIILTVEGETSSCYAPAISFGKSSLYSGKTGAATVYNAALNQMTPLGEMVITGNFKEMLIGSAEWDMIFPAESYEEAIALRDGLVIPVD